MNTKLPIFAWKGKTYGSYNIVTNEIKEGLNYPPTSDAVAKSNNAIKESINELVETTNAINQNLNDLSDALPNRVLMYNIKGIDGQSVLDILKNNFSSLPNGSVFAGIITHGMWHGYIGYRTSEYGAFLVFGYDDSATYYGNSNGTWYVRGMLN